ncbi:MAG: FAD-dependent oxidoreductase, partial [Candidatus Dormibacteria bacterium]
TMRCTVRRHAGGREFVPEPGTEAAIDAELVLLAIGFDGATPGPLLDGLGVAQDRRRNLVVDESFATGAPGVFAAGDAMRGAALIVNAIADGRGAARSCDRYLMGVSRLP